MGVRGRHSSAHTSQSATVLHCLSPADDGSASCLPEPPPSPSALSASVFPLRVDSPSFTCRFLLFNVTPVVSTSTSPDQAPSLPSVPALAPITSSHSPACHQRPRILLSVGSSADALTGVSCLGSRVGSPAPSSRGCSTADRVVWGPGTASGSPGCFPLSTSTDRAPAPESPSGPSQRPGLPGAALVYACCPVILLSGVFLVLSKLS